jgi:hypothetical protein
MISLTIEHLGDPPLGLCHHIDLDPVGAVLDDGVFAACR